MKNAKFLLVGVFACSMVLLTGCLPKKATLKCTQSSSGVDIEFIVGFNGNIIDSMDFSYDMPLEQYSDAQIEAIGKRDFCTSVKNSMKDYKEAFTDCKQDIVSKHLVIKSSLDVDKIAKNVLNKMTSPEKGKEALEKSGYTCTIEK